MPEREKGLCPGSKPPFQIVIPAGYRKVGVLCHEKGRKVKQKIPIALLRGYHCSCKRTQNERKLSSCADLSFNEGQYNTAQADLLAKPTDYHQRYGTE